MNTISIDKKNIQKILADFNTLTGIRVAYISPDLKLSVSVPQDASDFCVVLKSDPSANAKCIECDVHAFKAASETQSLYVYECHSGLIEAVAPIFFEGMLLGYLMMGQTLKDKPDSELWENTLCRCNQYKVNFDLLETTFYKLHCLNLDKVYAATRIMDICAKYIHLSKTVRVQEPLMIEKIKAFIYSHLDKPVSIDDLSRHLNVSSSHLSHIIKSGLNSTFTKLLMSARLEKAKTLLEQTDLNISEIAAITGFSDQNYFSRMFRRFTGVTASYYRNNYKIKA